MQSPEGGSITVNILTHILMLKCLCEVVGSKSQPLTARFYCLMCKSFWMKVLILKKNEHINLSLIKINKWNLKKKLPYTGYLYNIWQPCVRAVLVAEWEKCFRGETLKQVENGSVLQISRFNFETRPFIAVCACSCSTMQLR